MKKRTFKSVPCFQKNDLFSDVTVLGLIYPVGLAPALPQKDKIFCENAITYTKIKKEEIHKGFKTIVQYLQA